MRRLVLVLAFLPLLVGLSAFETPIGTAGPFNRASCVSCHQLVNLVPGNMAGGHGFPYQSAIIVKDVSASGMFGAHVIPLKNTEQAPIATYATETEHRFPPAIFGMASISSISDAAILAGERGRPCPSIDAPDRPGRFGRGPMCFSNLAHFVEAALRVEMGIVDPTAEDVVLRTFDVLNFGDPPAPTQQACDPADVARGEAAFYAAECDACHTPVLDGVPLYSDLRLHDLGPGEGEHRTAPLWDDALHHVQRMHDGGAGGVFHAVDRHQGDAKWSRDLFMQLHEGDRRSITPFIQCLRR